MKVEVDAMDSLFLTVLIVSVDNKPTVKKKWQPMRFTARPNRLRCSNRCTWDQFMVTAGGGHVSHYVPSNQDS